MKKSIIVSIFVVSLLVFLSQNGVAADDIDLSILGNKEWTGNTTTIIAGEAFTAGRFGAAFYIGSDGKAYLYKAGANYSENDTYGPKGILLTNSTYAIDDEVPVGIGDGFLRNEDQALDYSDAGKILYIGKNGWWTLDVEDFTTTGDHIVIGNTVWSVSPNILHIDMTNAIDLTYSESQ